jgi:hypothetical protein
MKHLYLLLLLICSTRTMAQVKVTQGNNSPVFTVPKQPTFKSYSTAAANYFIISHTESFENIKQMVVADKNGTIIGSNDVRLNMGVFNNNYSVKNLLVLGDKPMVFVENHNKATLKNTFSARLVDDNGKIATNETVIGAIDMIKMNNPGDWWVALTSDHKHLAVLSKAPHQKNTPDQFTYILLDENLKETGKGQFSFAGFTKEINFKDFLASDKGDLYLIAEEYDQSYTMPVIYKYSVNGQATILPVLLPDPKLRSLSFTYKVGPDGDLIFAGYTQKKATFSVGEDAVGTYLFSSARPSEPKVYAFDKPQANMVARNIVFNDDTFYLVGEQYKAVEDRSAKSANILAASRMDNVYEYSHNDIGITAFTISFNKKFDTFMNRKWSAKGDRDADLMVACGVINNKLAIIYNDEYGKYIDDKYRRFTKLPVAVLITNDGLTETPVQFAKQLDVTTSSYILFPQFFNNSDGKMVLLSTNAQSVKTVTFQ